MMADDGAGTREPLGGAVMAERKIWDLWRENRETVRRMPWWQKQRLPPEARAVPEVVWRCPDCDKANLWEEEDCWWCERAREKAEREAHKERVVLLLDLP